VSLPAVTVIGAGPAGLAVAAALKRKGVPAVVLERGAQVGASWRGRYDRLHLHTTRGLSDLPGLRFPRDLGRWVPRDGVIAYLERYAELHGLDVLPGTEVERIDRRNGGWLLRTSRGDREATHVIVATGYARDPFIPDWEGRARYAGELIHSSAYRNPTPYRDRAVLVVGAGNSGAEIAVDLVEGGAREVLLSVRTPPQIFPRQAIGIPAQAIGICIRRLPRRVGDTVGVVLQRAFVGDLSRHGMPKADRRPYSEFLERGAIPILDAGLIDLVKHDAVDIVAAVESLEGAAVVLADGRRLTPDVVIAATGYRCGLEPLVGELGLLDANGHPVVHGARTHPSAPGLHFIGFTNPISGNLRELGLDARRIARAISRAGPVGARTRATVVP
jgi:putative flavoprotein involved in K+ transport